MENYDLENKPISLSLDLTKKDYRQFYDTFSRNQKFLMIFLYVFCGGFLSFAIYQLTKSGILVSTIVTFLFPILFFVYIKFIKRELYVKVIFPERNDSISKEKFTLTDTHFVLENKKRNTKNEWTAFKYAIIANENIVLVIDKALLFFIPLSQISEEQTALIKSIVKEKIEDVKVLDK